MKKSILALVLVATLCSRGTGEPSMFRRALRIEPTLSQLETLPTSEAKWRLTPAVAAQFEAGLAAGAFPQAFAAALRARLTVDPTTGEGSLRPDALFLDLLPAANRHGWWAALAPSNTHYRWPLVIRNSELEEKLAGSVLKP